MESIYLVQRGEIRQPLDKYKGKDFSEAVKLDYMGSAEFEFGAIGKSLRFMHENWDKRHLIKMMEFDVEGEYAPRLLHFFDNSGLKEYRRDLWDVWCGRRLKEWMSFRKEWVYSRNTSHARDDFWWDIKNHTMWSFNKYFMDDCLEKGLKRLFDETVAEE